MANDPTSSGGDVELLLSLVQEPSSSGVGRRVGLCGRYLRDAPVGTGLRCLHRRPNNLLGKLLSAPAETPVVLVGSGSGVAPLRSVWQKRHQGEAATHLFYGCRDPAEDLFAEETRSVAGLRRTTAFSRLGGRPRRYVQDAFADQADVVRRMVLDEGGFLYVCGGVRLKYVL